LASVLSQFGHKLDGALVSNIELPAGAYFPATVPYKEWDSSEHDRPANYGLFKEQEHFLATVHVWLWRVRSNYSMRRSAPQ
jgi:hypothetical protein